MTKQSSNSNKQRSEGIFLIVLPMNSKPRLRYKSVPHISREQIERIQFPSIHSHLEQLEEPKEAQTSKEHQ